MLYFLKLSHSFGFLFYHYLFSLYFNLESFYWCIFNITDSFLSRVQSRDKPIKSILHFCLVLLICNIHFLFFQSFHLSHLIHVFTFTIGALKILIIVILILCLIIPQSVSYLSLVLILAWPLQNVFFSLPLKIFLTYLIIFCRKLNMMYWVIRTWVKGL